MTAETKVWLLSSGVYSDYRVHAAFTTKAEATKAMKLHGSDARVEERTLYGTAPTEKVSTFRQNAECWDDGSVVITDLRTIDEWPWDRMLNVGARPYVRFVRAPCHNGKGGRLEVSGTNLAAVRKVLAERLALIEGHRLATGKTGPQVRP